MISSDSDDEMNTTSTRRLDVYKIECRDEDGRLKGTYIGCGNYLNEFRQKKYQPPPKMRTDVIALQPYERFFSVTLLETCATRTHMYRRERELIASYPHEHGVGTLGPGGYNTLRGTPSSDPRFPYITHGTTATSGPPRRNNQKQSFFFFGLKEKTSEKIGPKTDIDEIQHHIPEPNTYQSKTHTRAKHNYITAKKRSY